MTKKTTGHGNRDPERSATIEKYLSKYPDTPTLTLARLMVKEHPAMFLSIEATRSAVRYRRGNNGNEARAVAEKNGHTAHIKENGKAGFYFDVPKSIAKLKRNFRMPQGKTAVFADVHLPYHDDKALEVALQHADKEQPDAILLLGDCMDFFSISRWDTNPEERNLSRELQLCRQFLAHLRERFPKARIILKMGNHEERWEKYLWAKAPELCGCQFITFEKIMELSNWGVELVQSRKKIKFGKNLTGIHGHELFGGGVPVNFARTLQLKMGVCTLGAHRHATSEHSNKTSDNKYVTCWGLGCLCDMSPDYAIINNWNHGFAQVELKGNDFLLNNYRIINGEVR